MSKSNNETRKQILDLMVKTTNKYDLPTKPKNKDNKK